MHCLAKHESPSPVAPEYIVEPATVRSLDSRCVTGQIVVTDFGESFLLPVAAAMHGSEQQPQQDQQQQQPQQVPQHFVGTPSAYCAPELLFDSTAGVGTSLQSDVWALGCTLFEIRAGAQLFESWFGGRDEVVEAMVETLGKLPEPWLSEWMLRTEDGSKQPGSNQQATDDRDRGTPVEEVGQLAERLRGVGKNDCGKNEESDVSFAGDQPDDNVSPRKEQITEKLGARLSDGEVKAFDDLLRKVFRYIPYERLSAREIRNHAWVAGRY